MESLEADWIKSGYEGAMLKDAKGLYKFGRSTVKEKVLIKIKRFSDSECIIIGFEEKLHNSNEKEKDELGFSKRASFLSGMVKANTLGSIKVVDIKTDIMFHIGTGLNDTLRKEIWDKQDEYLGKIVKYKHFESGKLELPRFPVFLGFRDETDL